jgi:hypothetical protein
VRSLALVVVVLATVSGGVLVALTQEPMRATIWSWMSHSCGTIEAWHEPRQPSTSDLATLATGWQAEDCFMRGYTRCQAVSLSYEWGGLDFSFTDTFVVEPAEGRLAGCSLAVISEGGAVGIRKTYTHSCTGVARLADGLHFSGCDAVVSVPTDTPPPGIPQATAVLGGSVFAFDQRFGANNCCSENGWTYQGPYGQMWTGVDIEQTGYGGSTAKLDERSLARVMGIEIGSGGGIETSWTMAQATAICDRFLPSDATYQKSTYVYGGSSARGIRLNYTSASLANTLPPSDFTRTDTTGTRPSPPGTFYVFYQYGHYTYGDPSSTTVHQCRIGTDEFWAGV